MDVGLLNNVERQVEDVRGEAFALVSLIERSLERGDGATNPQSSGSGTAATAARQPPHLESVLESVGRNDQRVRAALDLLYVRIRELDDSEVRAVSGGAGGGAGSEDARTGISMGPSGFFEDADASRTIATKVSRDVAHSLESEHAWRKNAFVIASQLNRYYHEKLALAFPNVSVGATATATASATATATSALQGQGQGQGQPPHLPHPHQAYPAPYPHLQLPQHEPSVLDLHQQQQQEQAELSLGATLAQLSGLVSFEAESVKSRALGLSSMRRLKCRWAAGLESIIDMCPMERPQQPAPSGSPALQPEEPLSLRGLRLTWVELRRSDGRAAESALARELTVAAQQRHFQALALKGEAVAVHLLLRWVAAQLEGLPAAPVCSDFASPLRLDASAVQPALL
jgi:hypothetical protein